MARTVPTLVMIVMTKRSVRLARWKYLSLIGEYGNQICGQLALLPRSKVACALDVPVALDVIVNF
jgi:hypothetical protein